MIHLDFQNLSFWITGIPFDDVLVFNLWCFGIRLMIDWSPFDDTLEGKTSSNGMNFLVIFKEDTKTFNDNHYLNPHRTPSLNREGWGGSPVGLGRGCFQTLHRTPLSSRKLHWFAKCFIILKHFEDNYICSPAAVAAVSLLGIKTSPADSFTLQPFLHLIYGYGSWFPALVPLTVS